MLALSPNTNPEMKNSDYWPPISRLPSQTKNHWKFTKQSFLPIHEKKTRLPATVNGVGVLFT